MSQGGYILLYRRVMESFLFQNPHYLKLWVYCLMKAAYKAQSVSFGAKTVALLPGEFIWGRKSAAAELNLGMKAAQQKSESAWHHMLQVLETEEMIARRREHRFTVIRVVNYAEYQLKNNAEPPAVGAAPAGGDPYEMFREAYAKPLTAVITQSITAWTNDFGGSGEVVAYAIKLAGQNGAGSPRYFEAILKTWRQKGIKTLAEAKAFTEEFEAVKERKITEKLEWQALDKQLERVASDKLPQVSMVNVLTEGGG